MGWSVGQCEKAGFIREDEVEVVVELIDESALRAEVCGEPEASEPQVAESLGVHGADEALDARLAEEIDGLAGIADQKDGLRVAIPIFCEEFNQLILGGGGVLHLVDQQVLQARAECGGQVVGARVFAEGVAREQIELSEVALIVGGEDELEFNQCAAEYTKEGFGYGPLVGWVVSGRQRADALEGVEKVVAVAQLVENRDEARVVAVLSVIDELEGLAGYASLLAPASILRREQMDEGEPVVEVVGAGLRRGVEIGAESDGRRHASVVWGGVSHLCGECRELGEEAGGEGLREREFKAGQDVGVEPFVIELRVGEGDEVAPLVAQAEHVG